MNASDIGMLTIEALTIALGFAVAAFGFLVLFQNYSQIGELVLNLKTAISGIMIWLGAGFLILAFNSIKKGAH